MRPASRRRQRLLTRRPYRSGEPCHHTQYDAAGGLIAGICKNDNSSGTGMVNQYQIVYDDLGRITAVYSNLEDGTYQDVTTYSYNGNNQVAQTTPSHPAS